MINPRQKLKREVDDTNSSVGLRLKPAIFCSDPTAVTETFVRRHITLLNGGDTLVFGEVNLDERVCSKTFPLASYSPILARHVSIRRLVRLSKKLPFVNGLVPKIWRQYVGLEIADKKFDFTIFEFGYIAARHWDYALFSEKPFFIYFRGIDASKLLKQEKYVETLKLLARHASGVIFVAPTLERNLKDHGLVLPTTLILPSGVDTKSFRVGKKDENLCVSIGRFVEKKGHTDTIRAFAKISSSFPDMRLAIFGDGPLLGTSQELAKSLNVEDKINFPGAVDHLAIRDALARATFYFQSSRTASDGDTEGFPSSIQEALASGSVVVSTQHAGANDFLEHEVNAMLFPEGDIECMVKNVSILMRNPDLLKQLASSGRQYAESFFDAETGCKRLEAFFKSCLIGK